MFRPFVDDFLACLRFYSRLPVPAPRGHEMPDFRTAVRALPLAGALIGLAPACGAARRPRARPAALSRRHAGAGGAGRRHRRAA